jgi:biopolymer transport protein TolR
MPMHVSRRKLQPREHHHAGELNLVPYLDITVNLVMFMLLSITGLLEFATVNVNAPKYDGGAARAEQANPNEKKLMLTVAMSRKGYFIAGAGAVLGADEATDAAAATGQGEPTIPVKNGEFDYASLTAKLAQIKTAFPTETRVIFAADPDIKYTALVKSMDAAREQDGKIMFPDVALSVLAASR